MQDILIAIKQDFEKQDGSHGRFSTFTKLCWSYRAKDITG